MYMMTPRDQISQDLSYFSGPNTSGAATDQSIIKYGKPRILFIFLGRLTNIVGCVARCL